MTSRSETTHLTRVSRVALDDDIKKRNSACQSENCCIDDHEQFRYGERDTHRRLSMTCFDMTSRSESTHLIRVSRVATDDTLHFEDLQLSRETLSDCHVSQKTAVLMMMDSSVNGERDTHRRLSQTCFDMTPGLPLMMTSKRETPFIAQSGNSVSLSCQSENCCVDDYDGQFRE